MSGKFQMDDYVPVSQRLEKFLAQYHDGSMQSEIVELTDSRVTVKALAYRSPDDPRPGVGHSSLEIPGSTPFTRGSEIENAETSAWGRAIAALGFEVKRGLASAEEVRNKPPAERPAPRRVLCAHPAADHVLTDAGMSCSKCGEVINDEEQVAALRTALSEAAAAHNLDRVVLERLGKQVGITPGKPTPDQLRQVLALIASPSAQPESESNPAVSSSSETAATEAGGSPSAPPPVTQGAGSAQSAPVDPPQPGTDAYRALPVSEKAKARAYWAAQAAKDEAEPEQLTVTA